VGGPGAPKIFLVVGHEGAYLSSKHGILPVTRRGRIIFQRNFAKMLGQKRGGGQSAKTVTPSKFFLADMFTTIMKLDGIRGKNSTLPPGAGSSRVGKNPREPVRMN